MKYIKINENGIHIVFGITDRNQIKLLHFSKADFCEEDICKFGPECKAEDLARRDQLIDAAAACGCEYYVIDAGWYAPGEWWDSVGEWKECRDRFPNGIKEVTDYIRKKGMVPGVWLELEVMGINCEKAKKAPDDWFFVRHGKRVYDRSRYQLYRGQLIHSIGKSPLCGERLKSILLISGKGACFL